MFAHASHFRSFKYGRDNGLRLAGRCLAGMVLGNIRRVYRAVLAFCGLVVADTSAPTG